jgi:DUF4097 and DUF4098 domain-containing protein YvlB
MAERRPLVLISGRVKELPTSDTLPGGSGLNFFVDQTPAGDTYGLLSGSVNGSNVTFTCSQGSYLSGSGKLYINGQLQIQGSSYDWVEATPASGTITLNTAPATGEKLTFEYLTEAGTPAEVSYSYYDTTPVNITAVSGRHFIELDPVAAGATMEVNFPSAVGNTAEYVVKRVSGGADAVDLNANGSENIEGAATATLRRAGESVTILSNNVELKIT